MSFITNSICMRNTKIVFYFTHRWCRQGELLFSTTSTLDKEFKLHHRGHQRYVHVVCVKHGVVVNGVYNVDIVSSLLCLCIKKRIDYMTD